MNKSDHTTVKPGEITYTHWIFEGGQFYQIDRIIERCEQKLVYEPEHRDPIR
jgi:hypothetical protein